MCTAYDRLGESHGLQKNQAEPFSAAGKSENIATIVEGDKFVSLYGIEEADCALQMQGGRPIFHAGTVVTISNSSEKGIRNDRADSGHDVHELIQSLVTLSSGPAAHREDHETWWQAGGQEAGLGRSGGGLERGVQGPRKDANARRWNALASDELLSGVTAGSDDEVRPHHGEMAKGRERRPHLNAMRAEDDFQIRAEQLHGQRDRRKMGMRGPDKIRPGQGCSHGGKDELEAISSKTLKVDLLSAQRN
jgi:hypothetical protein